MCRLVCTPAGAAGRRRGRTPTAHRLNAPTPALVTGQADGGPQRVARGRRTAVPALLHGRRERQLATGV
ncbi:hypothetical protein ABZ716_07510 [Streptomyces sp. NPDC006687]|uniref:hypothetical protein n=1 Tax=unclassified Streptomyces TaxID=2593676 RepID=UPI0033C0F472